MSTYRCGGMTLVEIMVAVGITVGMLLLIGTVFKSATDASGTAMALNDVSAQSRVLTRHIQKDFDGFQKDLPFAIIFEAHVDDRSTLDLDPAQWLGDPDEPDPDELDLDYRIKTTRMIRYDRICFFANGDYQPLTFSYPLSGNLARVFYGQMLDSPLLTIDNDVSAPRQILTRRQKIMTVSDAAPRAGIISHVSPAFYDADPYEFTWYPNPLSPTDYLPASPVTFWQNIPAEDFTGDTNFYFFDHPDAIHSFVRRPIYAYAETLPDGLQQLQMLSDVTDFKIQLYLLDQNQGRWRWFPNDQDMKTMSTILTGAPDPMIPFAFYWNVPDLNDVVDDPTWIPGELGDIPWWHENDGVLTNPAMGGMFPNLWPKAIRFTFTLYDKSRQRFPDGQTFSYIVKMPPRY